MAARTRSANGDRFAVQPGALVTGLVVGYGFILLAGALFGLAMAWTPWAPTPGARLFRAVSLVGVAVGGFYAGRAARGRSWLHGALTGAAAFAVALTTAGPPDSAAPMQWAAAFSLASLSGMVGGMAGGMIGSTARPPEARWR